MDTRKEAIAQLEELAKRGLTVEEGLEALREAAKGGFVLEAFDLVRVVLTHPRSAYLPELVDLFPAFSSMVESLILKFIGSWTEVEAAETYRDIILRYIGTEALKSLETTGFERQPRHVNVLFPGILIAADDPAIAADFYFLARAYAAAELLDLGLRDEITARAIKTFERECVWLIDIPQRPGVSWKWEETYQQHRRLTIAVLNFFAVKSIEGVAPALTAGLAFRDAVLVDTALHALANRGNELPDDAILWVAADPETRIPLFNLLDARDELDRLPRAYSSQVALAESAMVTWLCHPAELAAAPDEIELMEIVTSEATLPDGATDDLDYYLFRFRTLPPHWASDKGWLAGMAGPYLRAETPTTHAQGSSFSAFHPWEAKTAEEHAIEMVEILDRWRNKKRS
jgi:hypothetical protein